MSFTARTIFLFAFQPRATLRLPWARLCWPFRPFKVLFKGDLGVFNFSEQTQPFNYQPLIRMICQGLNGVA